MSVVEFVVGNEAWLRLGGFAIVLMVLAATERLWPARGDSRPARRQWSNAGLMLIDTLLLRLALPVLAVALAIDVDARGGGVFGVIEWPLWLEILVAVLIFDAAIYWQHRLLHRTPLLWRLHRVHHSDIAFDVTLGVRFHPLEAGLSMAFKLGLVLALGPHPAAVVIFELLLSASSLFTHADFAFPSRVDRALRAAFVTPSMHRIHHSVLREETDSNYGFLLSVWDRLFASYRACPREPERNMPVGLPYWRNPQSLTLGALLLQPLRNVPDSYPASGRDSPTRDNPHA